MGLKPGFGRLATLREALEILFSHPVTLGAESVPLDRSLQRVLAQDVFAPIDVPHFAKAAMDGYAVVATDTFGAGDRSPVQLALAGTLAPGGSDDLKVERGRCVEISTGAPMPPGADAVVMVEYTELSQGGVRIRRGVGPGDHVIRPASDIKRGEKVLGAGTLIRPSQIGVLAALGFPEIEVVSRPRVALLSTGPELLALGEELVPGRIYDINIHTLRAALTEGGFEVVITEAVPDHLDALTAAVRKGLESADLTLLSGGSSLGGSDLVGEAFERVGRLLLHGVAVKPGKPLVIGAAGRPGSPEGDGKLMIGLPGYPMSALSDFYVFVLPWLRHSMGVAEPARFTQAVLGRKHPSAPGRYEFLPVILDDGRAMPVPGGSSSISALASADGFIEIHENTEVLEQGEPVTVRLF